MSLHIEGFPQTGFSYTRKGGMPITNFIISEVHKIIEIGVERVKYEFVINTSDKEYKLTVCQQDIGRKRFLREVPVFILADEKEFYKMLYLAIAQKKFVEDEISYKADYGGLRKIQGAWMFVFVDGSIGEENFTSKVYSDSGGFLSLKAGALAQNRETAEKLFREYNRNPEVYFPLFFTNIMAITNAYFRVINEALFMKLTVWLDGASGSGKTELAKNVGLYAFSDEKQNKELVSATCRRSYAMRRLGESTGIPVILDDVKQERTRERTNRVRQIVDDYLRSVFQGRLTDPENRNAEPAWIDTCAVITGEYLDTKESQNARLLYLKVDGFLGSEKNRNSLRVLQEHPLWLTAVCAGYMQWLLGKMAESTFEGYIKKILQELRGREYVYGEEQNGIRLKENRDMMEMAAILTEMYFDDIGLSDSFMSSFRNNAKQSIQSICDSTFYLLGGENMIIINVLEKIFSACSIRKAAYVKYPPHFRKWKYHQENFWLMEDDDFLWIEDYEESMLKEGHEHDECRGKPYLLIREDRFIQLFQTQLDDLLEENKVSSQIADDLRLHLLLKLRERQLIYKQSRSDSKWGRPAAQYPVCEWEEHCDPYDDFYEDVLQVHCESVIQMNTQHLCIRNLKGRIKNENAVEDVGNNARKTIQGMAEDEIYKVRKAFTNNKSLYRE